MDRYNTPGKCAMKVDNLEIWTVMECWAQLAYYSRPFFSCQIYLQQLVSSKRDEPSGEQNTSMSVKGCRSISMRSSAAAEKTPMTASAFSERRRRSAARCKLLCLKGARKAERWAIEAMGGCRWFEELLRLVETESGGLHCQIIKTECRILFVCFHGALGDCE